MIFSEAQFNDALVQAIAADAGAVVVNDLYDDTLGNAPADTYAGMMRWNADRVIEAVSGCLRRTARAAARLRPRSPPRARPPSASPRARPARVTERLPRRRRGGPPSRGPGRSARPGGEGPVERVARARGVDGAHRRRGDVERGVPSRWTRTAPGRAERDEDRVADARSFAGRVEQRARGADRVLAAGRRAPGAAGSRRSRGGRARRGWASGRRRGRGSRGRGRTPAPG